MKLVFHFDYISPYAFFAQRWIAGVCDAHGLELVPVPTLFAAVLQHWGQLGPAEIPPKRAHTFRDIARYAGKHGIPLTGPAAHPFNPVLALRVSLPEVAGDRQWDVIDALYTATWCARLDPADAAQVAGVLDGIGLDGAAMVARTREPAVKAALRRNTEDAVAAGVFGVPTMRVGDARFWGNDQREALEAHLRGEDPLDPALAAALEAMPAGAVRRR